MFPSSPQAHLETFWRGQQRRLALALQKSTGYLHFWEPNTERFRVAPQEWVWISEGRFYGGEQPVDSLVSSLLDGLSLAYVGRAVEWTNDTLIFLNPSGRGTILLKASSYTDFSISEFRFEGGDSVFEQSSTTWMARLQQLSKAVESDFYFALQWVGKNPEQQAQRLVNLGRGAWDELHRVAQWILALEDCAAPPTHLSGHMYIEVGIEYTDKEFYVSVLGTQPNFAVRYTQLWHQWLRFFNMSLRYDVIDFYTAAKQVVDEQLHWEYPRRRAPLSHQEQLNLGLQIRDWLYNRVGLSSERIAELLA